MLIWSSKVGACAKHRFTYEQNLDFYFTLTLLISICFFLFFPDPCVYVNLEFKGGDLSVIPSLGYSACKEQCQKLKSCSFFSGRVHHINSRIWKLLIYMTITFFHDFFCFCFSTRFIEAFIWDQNGQKNADKPNWFFKTKYDTLQPFKRKQRNFVNLFL